MLSPNPARLHHPSEAQKWKMARLAGRPPRGGGLEVGRAERPGVGLRGRVGVGGRSLALGKVVSQAGTNGTGWGLPGMRSEGTKACPHLASED